MSRKQSGRALGFLPLYLVFIVLCSSCGSTSFLHRQYTPGVYVEHVSKIKGVAVYPPASSGCIAAAQEKVQTQLEKDKPCTSRFFRIAESGVLSENLIKRNCDPAVVLKSLQEEDAGLPKVVAEKQKMQKVGSIKVAFSSSNSDEDPAERDSNIAFVCGIFLPILMGVLLTGLFLLLLMTVLGGGPGVLALTYFLTGAGLAYLVFDILTSVFVVKSIIEARQEGVSISGKTWTALLLSGIPNLIFLGLMLLSLAIPWKKRRAKLPS
jgi:hypothetical protein